MGRQEGGPLLGLFTFLHSYLGLPSSIIIQILNQFCVLTAMYFLPFFLIHVNIIITFLYSSESKLGISIRVREFQDNFLYAASGTQSSITRRGLT